MPRLIVCQSKGGGVGEDPDRVVVQAQFAVHEFRDQHGAGRVGNVEMDGKEPLEGRKILLGHVGGLALKGGLGLGHRSAGGEEPIGDLPTPDGSGGFRRIDGKVLRVAREVEQRDDKALLVHPVSNDIRRDVDVHPDEAILRRPLEAPVLAIRGSSREFRPMRHDDRLRVEGEPEFHRAEVDPTLVECLKLKCGAGLKISAGERCGDKKQEGQEAVHGWWLGLAWA